MTTTNIDISTMTPEELRSLRAKISSALRVKKTGGRNGGRPKGAKNKKPSKRIGKA